MDIQTKIKIKPARNTVNKYSQHLRNYTKISGEKSRIKNFTKVED